MCYLFIDIWSFLNVCTAEDLKNLTSSLFSTTAIILGILTYLQARKSFFAPKKTEVYKLQIEELREAYKLFETTSEEIKTKTQIAHLGMATTATLIIQYIIHNLIDRPHGIAITDEAEFKSFITRMNSFLETKYSKKIRPEGFDKTVESEVSRFSDSFIQSCGSSPELAWEIYFVREVRLSNDHVEYMSRIRKIQSSAIVPEKIKIEINSFISHMENLYLVILEVVNAQKDIISDNFKELSDFTAINIASFGKDALNELDTSALQHSANRIISMINKELKTDELWR